MQINNYVTKDERVKISHVGVLQLCAYIIPNVSNNLQTVRNLQVDAE